MTSFMTLLKRDLRLQVPMMMIYSAVLVLIAGGFTWAAIKYSSDALYGGIPIFFVLQFVFLMFALPINAIWKEWRMKTVAHWLMLPASVHKKIWSKALSVVIWTLYIIFLVVILWAITGLIGQTAIHTGSYQLVKAFLTVDLLFTLPYSLVGMLITTIPIFLAVIMVKGEKGWKGILFTAILFIFFVILAPWFYAVDPLPILEIGPIYTGVDISQGEFAISESEFSVEFTGDAKEPYTYVSAEIINLLILALMYYLTWWYLARKVEI